ncbi:uncharacterized protein LOC126590202 [Malus sylvestris]|uniref:uncharacterized protein LOC126590202 n=1 Tax=Malus sylvestris TaxID=3752 RepID=UPI0021ABF392|nr:uncharacterized protein LOC126590202 [Malus sylvestris]
MADKDARSSKATDGEGSRNGEMDKQWIHNPNRCADEYLDGINQFIDFAIANNCVRNGMMETYTTWNHHGEQIQYVSSSDTTRVVDTVDFVMDPNDQIMNIINDVFPTASSNTIVEVEDDIPLTMDSESLKKYEKLLKSAEQKLYPSCEGFSMLTAIVELMHGKPKFRMLNQCFDYFFGVFKRMLPNDNCLPKDHKSEKKVLSGLELGYEKIHACKNNYILFYKENKALDKCPVCNELRFKMTSQNRRTKIPQKVMCYLPLKPRLQRFYMSMHTASDMRWHKDRQVDDDVMRHPADGEVLERV